MDGSVAPVLDILKNTFMEAKDSKFTNGKKRLAAPKTQSGIPLIQDAIGKAHVSIIIDSVMEEPLPSRQIWSICKIPLHVRQDNEKAYAPRLVSIGPFHYKKPGLEFMEAQKLRFLDRLVARSSHHNVHLLKVLGDAVKELEAETRECYAEDLTHIDSASFTKMMLVDGCFAIELLRLSGRRDQVFVSESPSSLLGSTFKGDNSVLLYLA